MKLCPMCHCQTSEYESFNTTAVGAIKAQENSDQAETLSCTKSPYNKYKHSLATLLETLPLTHVHLETTAHLLMYSMCETSSSPLS